MHRQRALRRTLSVMVLMLLAVPASAQAPLDLFSDVPPLGDCCIRIGGWNLRHINIEGQASTFLPGATRAEDFEILIATFAKAIQDLGLEIVAISEHQPRANQPNRLHQIRDALNGSGAGPWMADESHIVYAGPPTAFGGLQLAVLWNSDRVTIDPDEDELLVALRQGDRLRAPWRVPVTAGALSFDMMLADRPRNLTLKLRLLHAWNGKNRGSSRPYAGAG